MPNEPFILASSSPRRRELLTQAGFSFRVQPSNVPEEQLPGEDPVAFVLRLAQEKARAVSAAIETPSRILAADTVVVSPQGLTLGKPADAADAIRMLNLLSGATHKVITGVCLLSPDGTEESASELTYVTFRTLSQTEIEAYVSTGEPTDKAGAYAIQGYAAKWIPRIQGCFYNVVGLPLALVSTMLEASEPATLA